MPWSMKPTHILIRGGETDLKLPLCKFDCEYRFPDGEDGKKGLHKHAIRLDDKSHPGQTKATGGMRYAIPRGLFQIIQESHERYLCAEEGKQPGSKVVACADCVRTIASNLVGKNKTKSKGLHKSDAKHKLQTARRLWYDLHCRHGHPSRKRMKTLARLKGIVGGGVSE